MTAVVPKLLRWYRQHKRQLPWRDVHDRHGRPDAYKIFCSEIMLQQTQVERVIPKFSAWLKSFPSWRALANATNADVIRAWSGFGYNRRALMARNAARHVVVHGIPDTEEAWRKLPGVGPYTAAALACFVNRKRAIAIDTNVRRVVGRLLCGIPYPRMEDEKRIRRNLETAWPKKGEFWDIPAAFMDFGSLVCTAKAPRCAGCPFRMQCRAAVKIARAPTRKARMTPNERRHRGKPFPDRIYRGRILACVIERPRSVNELGKHIDTTYDHDKDCDWIASMVQRLCNDQLLRMHRGKLFLSQDS